MKNGKNYALASVIFMFFAVTAVLLYQYGNVSTLSQQTETNRQQYSYGDLLRDLKENKVKSVEITKDSDISNAGTAKIVLNNAELFVVQVVNVDNFTAIVDEMKLQNPSLEYRQALPAKTTFIFSVAAPIVVMLISVFLLIFLVTQMGGGGRGVMSFGKSRAKPATEVNKKVTFNDVAGLEEEKEELLEIVEFLKDKAKFVDIGAKIPKGVLLVGLPGTGKTYISKAVAGEAGVPFFSISGSDFVEMFVGVGASRVRDLFEQAKKNAPCIVFIDEIDAVGRRRGAGLGGGHDEREQTLNQLLVEMDGFGLNEGVIILAATNRPDILDPALLRPGRFDRRVVIDKPDVKGRRAVLDVHARGKKMAADVDLQTVAQTTAGFAPADLANLLNEAALLAARGNQKEIHMEEIRRAFVKIGVGTEKKSRVMSDKEKRITAYHEAGHAVLHEVLPELDPVHIISIIPTGRAGGYTMHLPGEDKSYVTKKYMEQDIVAALGGRAAEYLILDDITTGASGDIEHASAVARAMVTKYGMSTELGPIQFGDDNEEVFIGRDLAHTRNYGEQVASAIDAEIKHIIENAYKTALENLKNNMEVLHRTAALLIEKEKVTGDEFRVLFKSDSEVLLNK